MIKNINLNYEISVFRDADFTQHYGSCISYQVKEQTDQHEKVGGFPPSYSEDNTRIQQIWFEDGDSGVDYARLGELLDMDVKTISAILQPPGNTVTLHRDTFFKFKSPINIEILSSLSFFLKLILFSVLSSSTNRSDNLSSRYFVLDS